MREVFELVPEKYGDYLTDESRIPGFADSISFPESEADVVHIVEHMNLNGITITLQGARTGLSGGAVPQGGHVMNLSRMKKVLGLEHSSEHDEYIYSLEPGVLLGDLTQGARQQTNQRSKSNQPSHSYFFPADPTEISASIGGIVGCHALGSYSYGYGPTRRYISGLRVVLSDGTTQSIKRGEMRCREYCCQISLHDESVEFELPRTSSANPRLSAGYFSEQDMDLIDLFIGAEGTLGVVTGIDVRLVHEPSLKWGCICFFPSANEAVRFVGELKWIREIDWNAKLAAIEYIDQSALRLIEEMRPRITALKTVPIISGQPAACIYFELHGDDETGLNTAFERTVKLIESCGGDPDASWAATESRELDVTRTLRHAVLESASLMMSENIQKSPGLSAICTNLAVKERDLNSLLDMYKQDLEDKGIRYIMYGHIGNNNLHVNLLPRDMSEHQIGIELYEQWARTVAGQGGTLFAEHGIGKQKNSMLQYFIGERDFEKMKRIKGVFDRTNTLNRLNIFGK